ncbi:hypothetical protein EXS57_00845 [Candidatus Kaiserbacteria bacterium]|nr:hypothetical protein [Candidatus Kaiserbacteria bacterium]
MTHYPLLPSRAFTLIETVIVIGFSTSMMLALGLVTYHFNKILTYEQTASWSSGSASTLMREIGSLVLPARAVLQTHTFSGTVYTSTSTVLVLEIPSIDNSGSVIANTFDYAVVYASSTEAYRVLAAHASSKRVSGTKKLSSTISSLIFTYNNTDFTQVSTTTVDVQTRAYAKQDMLTDHRSEQMRLRNH